MVPATRHVHGENMFGALGKCNSRTPFSSAPLTRIQVCMVRAFSSRWRLRIGDCLSCFRWRIPRKSFFLWWWTWKTLTGLLFDAGTYWKSNDTDHARRAQVCLIGHIAVLCSWVSLALIRSIWCGGEGGLLFELRHSVRATELSCSLRASRSVFGVNFVGQSQWESHHTFWCSKRCDVMNSGHASEPRQVVRVKSSVGHSPLRAVWVGCGTLSRTASV